MRVNSVKKALKEGRLQLGCGLQFLPLPETIRLLASAGFDWAFIDAEHGIMDQSTLYRLCQTAQTTTITPIVRVVDLQYGLIARALDCGAEGVIFPRVESPEILEQAVSWTLFPPEGGRGCGLGPLHTDFAPYSIAETLQRANEERLVVLQIETQRALDAREELLSIRGIDAVLIGPVDLSINLGVPGEFEHPKMLDAVEKIAESCRKLGVAPGVHCRALPLAKRYLEYGMQLLSCGSETSFMVERGREVINGLK